MIPRPVGKKLSEETKAKIKAALNRPEVRAKRIGQKRSEQARARMSAAHVGRKLSEEHKAAIGAAHKGRKFSPEHLAKISVALKARPGRKKSTDEKRRISASLRGNTNARDAPIKGTCVYCGRLATTFDHIIPSARGGEDSSDNLAPCCVRCNASKQERTPEEWLADGLLAS